jgi:murein L,D-transpeptidase YcbB/YkuD
MAQDTQTSQDEERRLLAISLACSAQEDAAADQLLHSRSLPHPAYMRLADAYQSLRIESKEKWLAVRTYRRKMRDGRRDEKINNAAVLQAHMLSQDPNQSH